MMTLGRRWDQKTPTHILEFTLPPSTHTHTPSLAPTAPRITGPLGPVTEGDTVVLICSTTDNRPINWTRVDGMPIDDPLESVMQDGIFTLGSLTIVDVRERKGGMYKCRVREENALFVLQIKPTTSKPDPRPHLCLLPYLSLLSSLTFTPHSAFHSSPINC